MIKKTFIILSALFLSFIGMQVQAQVTTPWPSPFCKMEQKVGLTDVTIEYSRPGVKGRAIFGGLLPYGEIWRAGANAATKITFGTDVNIAGHALPAGSYALLITPGKEQWQLHFYAYDSGDWPDYVADGAPAPVADITAMVKPTMSPIETWTIGLGDLRNDSATLYFLWENSYVSVPLTVATDDMVMESINKTMAGPGAGDYSSAATYYLNQGKDLNKALEWITMGIEKGGERFWLLRTKALIQAKLGDYKGAIASAQRSTALAKEAGNSEYPRINDESIAEWTNK